MNSHTIMDPRTVGRRHVESEASLASVRDFPHAPFEVPGFAEGEGRAQVLSEDPQTGEATLRGRVLPVGGIKSKVLAAHRYGLKRIVLPRKNEPDLEDVPKEALDELEIVLVDSMREVLDAALTDAPRAGANGEYYREDRVAS